jgi:hypothetical protein
MTLLLETQSHGEVESGFFSTFTQFARLDKHTFATRHFCELAQSLAENPQVRKAQLLSYNLDKFWQRQKEHVDEFTQVLMEAEQSYLPELQKFDMDRQLKGKQGQISIEDEVNMYDEGRMIPVIVTDDEKLISIGDYKIAALHFGRMAVYLAHGGFLGWMDGQKPEFAEPTIEAIKLSNRKLYRQVREELSAAKRKR